MIYLNTRLKNCHFFNLTIYACLVQQFAWSLSDQRVVVVIRSRNEDEETRKTNGNK